MLKKLRDKVFPTSKDEQVLKSQTKESFTEAHAARSKCLSDRKRAQKLKRISGKVSCAEVCFELVRAGCELRLKTRSEATEKRVPLVRTRALLEETNGRERASPYCNSFSPFIET